MKKFWAILEQNDQNGRSDLKDKQGPNYHLLADVLNWDTLD